ncbi:Rossman fold protein, TIGR00730 family [Chryseobacterium sp. T16E-39]|uniref:LOG family protein n=1 Tax=Chryseobacterium sp. T16E-39 TaxID=2015076 RepID=UPI000B5B1A1A|nr:TIGR00730 family Rossman fold protein [Chryseobacterium sp. T16E-39]ASK32680.1 Rossman fold protein, TIGR00730 family [Chryseobacterium sp. T16E-39]
MLRKVAVFCGSSLSNKEIYHENAIQLGQLLASNNIELVYGGSDTGLMGILASAVIDNGGTVIGVLPDFLKKREIAHNKLSQLIVVNTMHERKAMMNELSDAFIALPGGLGTLDELFEMLTWLQLGLHQKQIILLNIDGFYDPLLAFLQTMSDQKFLKPLDPSRFLVCNSTEDGIKALKNRMP